MKVDALSAVELQFIRMAIEYIFTAIERFVTGLEKE